MRFNSYQDHPEESLEDAVMPRDRLICSRFASRIEMLLRSLERAARCIHLLTNQVLSCPVVFASNSRIPASAACVCANACNVNAC